MPEADGLSVDLSVLVLIAATNGTVNKQKIMHIKISRGSKPASGDSLGIAMK